MLQLKRQAIVPGRRGVVDAARTAVVGRSPNSQNAFRAAGRSAPVCASGSGFATGSGSGCGSGSGNGSGNGDDDAAPVESMAHVDSDDDAFVSRAEANPTKKRCKPGGGDQEAEELALAISRVDQAIRREAANECGRRISAVFRAAGETAEMPSSEPRGTPSAQPSSEPSRITPSNWPKDHIQGHFVANGTDWVRDPPSEPSSESSEARVGIASQPAAPEAGGQQEEECDHPMLICCRGYRLHWDQSYVPHCGGCDQLVHVSHLKFCPDVCGCDDYTEVHGSDNENCQYCQFGESE